MQTLPRLTAVEFRGELNSGATRPCVFLCEDENGLEAEHVTKLRRDVRSSGLTFEYVSARLAHHFELPIPDPALIELTLDLAMTQGNNGAVQERILRNVGLNFGTKYLAGLTTWPKDRRIPGHLRQAAMNVFAFDALIDNADRRIDKPNLLAGSDRLFVIDHELAFSFVRLIAFSSTWRERLRFLREHPFFESLRGTRLELNSFAGRLLQLTDEAIDTILAEVPPDFGREHLPAIAERLREARDDSAGFLGGLAEVAR